MRSQSVPSTSLQMLLIFEYSRLTNLSVHKEQPPHWKLVNSFYSAAAASLANHNFGCSSFCDDDLNVFWSRRRCSPLRAVSSLSWLLIAPI